jgi:predicted dehydrogenase/flavin reductase (DIM6/NTAB) family NADH-FMN oxidoreductase RutF
MKVTASTIWDTRIQGVTGVLTVKAAHGVELFATATFSRLSDQPPRVIVSSNYKYAVDQAIADEGCFAINIMPDSAGRFVAALMKVRRREANKPRVLHAPIVRGESDIPYLASAHAVLFCQVERDIEAGDRRLYVGRILRTKERIPGTRPLLFGEVLDSVDSAPRLQRLVRTVGRLSGIRDAARRLRRIRGDGESKSLAATTYEIGGATPVEIEQVLAYGTVDNSRRLRPPGPVRAPGTPIGVCVVGTSWGAMHCDWIRKVNPQARLFLCGRDRAKAARLARRVGAVDVFADVESAARDARVQCLTIALPHDMHKEAVEIAAAAGKHVLVEKPIATNLDDARQMMAAAERAGTILMVAENAHYRPAIYEAVRRIERGDIGEPLYLLAHGGGPLRPNGWKRDRARMGGGVLMDIGVHYIRALRLLMGEPDETSASRAMQINTRMGGEDSVQLVFSSESGWEAHMLLSWATCRGAVPDLVVAGDRGTLHLWPGKRLLDFYPIAPTRRTRLVSMIRPFWLQTALSTPMNQRIRVRLRDRDRSGYLGEVRDFLACVAENKAPSSTPWDACRDLEIVLAAYQSLEERRRVAIPSLFTSPPQRASELEHSSLSAAR